MAVDFMKVSLDVGLNPFIYRAELDAKDGWHERLHACLNPFIYRAELDA